MQQQEAKTGTKDSTYNLVSLVYHALQGAENYEIYARDAEQDGDNELSKFFREMKDQEQERANRAKQMLAMRLQQSGQQMGGQQMGGQKMGGQQSGGQSGQGRTGSK